ncbi:MAG: hypothetical protein RLZ63_1803 [Pseudomonadota bacterium]|jgi:hypothetical protein
MMVFTTHCCKSLRRSLGVWLLAQLLWSWAGLSHSQTPSPVTPTSSSVELTELRLERADKSLVLNSALRLELGSSLEDALLKGVAIHFVVQADVYRDRWYWSDQHVAGASRYYRLLYQPLTRRWRLSMSREPLSANALGNSLSQNFDSLTEALALVRRVYGWPVVDVAELSRSAHYYVRYQFRLDVNQLPRPFQISTGAQSDWNLGVSRELGVGTDLLQ